MSTCQQWRAQSQIWDPILHFPDVESIVSSEKTYLHNDYDHQKKPSNGRLTDKTLMTVKASSSHEGNAFPLIYREIESSKINIEQKEREYTALTPYAWAALCMTVVLCTRLPQSYFSRSKTISSTLTQPNFAYRDSPRGVASSQVLAPSTSIFARPD